MRTAHASETTMKGEQGRGGAVKVFGEVSKDREGTRRKLVLTNWP